MHLYEMPSGKPIEYEVDGDDGPKMLPMVRSEDMPTPCHLCPKGGPENDTLYNLSSRNWEAYMLYGRLEATFGTYQLPQYLARCEVFAENMRLVRVAKENGINRAKADAYDRSKQTNNDP